MIQYSENRYRNDLKLLWKTCFPSDSDRFIDLYFDSVYRNDETLICLLHHRPIAALQIIPYSIAVAGDVRQGGYLSGIMTHPAHRNRGHMHRLLQTALAQMREKSYDYAFLIPQQASLAALYARYGFRLCETNPQPPVNRVLKTPAQWAVIRQDYFIETGLRLSEEPFVSYEKKGMILRLRPEVKEITTLYMGMMMD